MVADPLGELVLLVADAAGDAYENADAVRDGVRIGVDLSCALGGLAGERAGLFNYSSCRDATRPYEFEPGLPRVGPPADAALDVLSASAAATGDVLVVELEAGRLSTTFDWTKPDTATVHQVCWDSVAPWTFNRTLCDHGVVLWTYRDGNEEPEVLWSAYVDRGPDCTSAAYVFGGCIFPIPYAITEGAPGKVRWEVPRARLGGDAELTSPFAVTQQGPIQALREWPFNCLCFPGPTDGLVSVVDVSPVGEPMALPPPTGLDPADPMGSPGVDAEGDWVGAPGGPEIDILSTTVRETEANLTLSVELAAVEETPVGHVLYAHFGLPGRAYWVGLRMVGESVQTRFVACEGRNPDGWCARYTEIPAQIVRVPGAPGRAEFVFARADLGFPLAGETVHSVWSVASVIEREYRAPERARRFADPTPDDPGAIDFGGLAPTMRLGSGEPPRIPDGLPESRVVEDETFDLDYTKAPCFLQSCDRFDITYVVVQATTATTTDVTIGISDLSVVSVPAGYHSVVYAAALLTNDAQTMVGYSRDQDNQDKFFCGPDNLVLVGTPLDPASVASIPITGLVSLGQRAQGVQRGGATSGSITIHVPHECFGKRDGGPLRVDALGAGTFAVSNPTKRAGDGTPEPQDSAALDEPFTIASVAPPAPPLPPWYTRDIFYNALGAFLAVVTIGFTLAVYYRRRRLMQWYLDELTRIDSEYRDDAIQRAKGILALRRRLHSDIVKHRVSDSEYIRDRIRGSLTSARLVSLSDDYFDLPAPLTLRIERVLDDGRMTAEEGRLVEKVMQRVKLPEEGRALLIERIRTWVDEDASWG